MRKLTCIFCLFFLSDLFWAQQMTPFQYIEKYKDAAMYNMREKKVPASITLAQGILESGAGNSDLATLANNHFGIKCHTWNGETYYKDDDAPNECFRKYASVQDSYADHAQFLISRPRYAKCFQLDITDYKGWARELKAAGYATLPTYAEKLIHTIEKYNLHQFDLLALEPQAPQKELPTAEPLPIPQKDKKNMQPERNEYASAQSSEPERLHIQEMAPNKPQGVVVVNGLNAVYAQKGDTRMDLALRYGLAEWQIRRYNDMTHAQELQEGMLIFLEPKLEICHSSDRYTIAPGEDLWQIAQKHGIKLNALKSLNGLGSGTPEPGTVLRLK